MKRTVDFVVSVISLMLLAPLLALIVVLIWIQDRKNPFYTASRMGLGNEPFRMIKFRSMVQNADKTGVDSTGNADARITRVGKFLRRFKIDELPQLINVLRGEMSLVGPRPNVEREVRLYSGEELHLLDVRPGITDLSSIVFADEGDILAGSADPDITYNQLIRPGKSGLGLFYVRNQSMATDLKILRLTVRNSIDRQRALSGVAALLKSLNAPINLVTLSARNQQLVPSPPPGMTEIVTSRG